MSEKIGLESVLDNRSFNKALKQYLSGIGKMEGETGKASKTLSKIFGNLALAAGVGLAAGIAAATAAVVKLGVAITRLTVDAARVQAVKQTFDSLVKSIGTDMPRAIAVMRTATRGMVNDIDLMRAGNRFLSMGLAETSDETGVLSEVATQLGMAMGFEATKSMEDFALMLANMSIPRLDTFGISAGKVRQRIKELQEETKGLDRSAAFMIATLEQAKISMARIGEQGGTAGASMARLQVMFENLRQQIGERFLPVFSALLVIMNILAQKYLPSIQHAIDNYVLPAMYDLGTWMMDELPAAIERLTAKINNDLIPAVKEIGGTFIKTLAILRLALTTFELVASGLSRAFIDLLEALEGNWKRFWIKYTAVAELGWKAIINTGNRKGALFIKAMMAVMDMPVQYATKELPSQWGKAVANWFNAVDNAIQAYAPAIQQDMYGMGDAARRAFMAGLEGTQHEFIVAEEKKTLFMWKYRQYLSEAQSDIAAQIDDFIARLLAEMGDVEEATKKIAQRTGASVAEVVQVATARLFDLGNALVALGSQAAALIQARILTPMQQELTAIEGRMKALYPKMRFTSWGPTGPVAVWEEYYRLQRNRLGLTEEIADQEERILEFQRKQQELAWLQQQIELLNLIREQGLDAADILGGLELGIEANAADVVDAMTRALQQVIEAAQAELEISSPSRVLAAEVGSPMAQGIVLGIEQYAGEMRRALGGMFMTPSLLGLPAGAGAARGGDSRTVNLQMDTTINDRMDAALFEAMTLRTVRRALG